MNHAGLGYINGTGKLYLPIDLIDHLSIGNESTMYGLFYPPRKGIEYKDATIKHDFMLTPIPDKLWAKSARLLIHLLHKPGTLKTITEFFHENKISVIHAECSRSGHRYATWSLHVAFEDLNEPLTFNEYELYTETVDKLEKLKENLFKRCMDVLFIQKNEMDLNSPIMGWPNSPLAFYANQLVKTNKNDVEYLHQPFKLAVNTTKGCFESKYLKEILTSVGEKESENLLDTIVYAELDKRALNIRMVVIPKSRLSTFFEIGITYERIGNPDTCVGIISEVVNSLPEQYNMWRFFNFLKSNTPAIERGSLNFLIEDTRKHNSGEYNFFLNEAQKSLKKLQGKKINKNTKLLNPMISPISMKKIVRRIATQKKRKKEFQYDVFLSYSHKDEKSANVIYNKLKEAGIDCFKAADKLKGGDKFTDKIKNALLNSWEVCFLFSKKSIKSKWVHRELGSAWILDKKCVPIVLEIRKSQVPIEFSEIHAYDYFHIDRYIKDLKLRKEEFELSIFEESYA